MDTARFVPSTRRLGMRAARRLLPLLLTLAITLPAADPSFSALRTGTHNAETLIGTDGNDQLNGMGNADTLKGKAGNDTYYFGNGFSTPGIDKLIEKPGQGTDTLNFRGVTRANLQVMLVREWTSINGYRAVSPGGDEVNLVYNDGGAQVKSFIETVVGSRGDNDTIMTGGGSHTLQPGSGSTDFLWDFGGYDDGPGGNPDIAASNDVYKGFADNTGSDEVGDHGGASDVLDMRPFSTEDVYIAPYDFDGDERDESLQIVTGFSSQVFVVGHFAPYFDGQENGRMERIIFADQTITDSSALRRATTESLNARQAKLAKAAPKLARQARTQLARHDPIGKQATSRDGDGTADGRSAADASHALSGSDQHAKSAKKAKAKKAKHAKQGAKPRGERQGKHRHR